MSKDERIYLERIAVALEEKAEIEHPDKGYLDSKTYMERIADAVEQLPSGGGGITPTGNIAITENTAEGSPLDISQYATATVNVSGDTIPKCAVTVINDREDTINIITLNDSGILNNVGIAVNDTETLNCLYFVNPLTQETVVTIGDPGAFMLSSNAFTDITNLTVKEFIDSYYVEVTDPTKDSACTIHASDLV